MISDKSEGIWNSKEVKALHLVVRQTGEFLAELHLRLDQRRDGDAHQHVAHIRIEHLAKGFRVQERHRGECIVQSSAHTVVRASFAGEHIVHVAQHQFHLQLEFACRLHDMYQLGQQATQLLDRMKGLRVHEAQCNRFMILGIELEQRQQREEQPLGAAGYARHNAVVETRRQASAAQRGVHQQMQRVPVGALAGIVCMHAGCRVRERLAGAVPAQDTLLRIGALMQLEHFAGELCVQLELLDVADLKLLVQHREAVGDLDDAVALVAATQQGAHRHFARLGATFVRGNDLEQHKGLQTHLGLQFVVQERHVRIVDCGIGEYFATGSLSVNQCCLSCQRETVLHNVHSKA